MTKNNDEFARELAKKYDITIFVAKQIIDSPFKFLKDRIVEKKYEGIMLPYLGKFIVKPGVKDFLIRLHENKEKGENPGDCNSNNQQGIVEERGDSSGKNECL